MTRRTMMAIVLVAAATVCGHAMAANLVTNPGFESVDATTGGFTGWSITGSNIAPDTVYPNLGNTDALFGDPIGASPLSTLSQSIATDPGAEYTLTFALLDEAGVSGDTFAVQFGGFAATITGDQAAPPGTLPSFYTTFTFDGAGADITDPTSTLTFQGQSTIDWNLDDVSLTGASTVVTAPEPATLALFAISMPVLACLRRGRQS